MIKTQNDLIKKMVIISIIFSLSSILLKTNRIEYIQGIVVGMLLSVLKLIFLRIRIQKQVYLKEKQVFWYSISGYTLRYLLTALVLVVAIVTSYYMFFGTVLGLLSLKVALLIKSFN